jgi:hypothetical protein
MKFSLALLVCLFSSAIAFAADGPNLLAPFDKAESWRLEQHEGGTGHLEAVDGGVAMGATKVTGTDWHVQAFLTDLDLKEGHTYTLKLKLTAPKPRGLTVVAGIDQEDWHSIGLQEDIRVENTVRDFEFTFQASQVAPGKNRLGFMLGSEEGDVIVKGMTLTEKR